MINLNNVSLVFQGGSVALSNITTSINEGEFVYLVGHSGSGKSSFLKLLYKEYISTKGEIEVAGLNVVQLQKWKTPLLRRKLGVVTQEPQLLEKRNTYENISFALEVMGSTAEEIESKTNTLLDLVELNENAFKFPDQLSGGEQTRVSIARSLANNPLILLCDEPTGNLDPDLSIQIVSLLEKINRAGTTVVMATHDSSIVNRRKKRVIELSNGKIVRDEEEGTYILRKMMNKFSYVIKNTILNMRRTPLLVFATIIAVLVSSFLVFTTLSARSIVQNNTLRWQNGTHVVVFLDDRVTTTAHKQLQESLESYSEVRTVDYFTKAEAEDEFRALFKDQPDLLSEVDYEKLPSSLRVNLNNPSDYELIIERMDGNPAVKEIRTSGEAIERLLSLTDTLVISASAFALLVGFAAFILIINTLRLAAYSKKKEIKIMRLVGASSTYIRLPFIFEAIFESLIGTSIAVGLGWGIIEYSKNSIVAESIFDITISDSYLIYLTVVLLLSSIIFGLIASFVGIRKVLND